MNQKLGMIAIATLICLLAGVSRLALAQGGSATAIYYERQTTTEINGQDLHTTSMSTTKVWRKGPFLRVESPAMPGAQKQVTIRRDGYIYYLNLTDKSAIRVIQPETAGSAAGEEPVGDPKEYVKALTKNGARLTGTTRIGSEDASEYTIPIPDKTTPRTPTVHKLWVATASEMPIMETIESPNVKTTTLYQNIQRGQNLPDELFAIPSDFKIVDVGRQSTTLPAQTTAPKK